MKVTVTGASGFIGRNLLLRLSEIPAIDVVSFSFANGEDSLLEAVTDCDWVIHLAGVNRPESADEFHAGNVLPLEKLCGALQSVNSDAKILLASSIQAGQQSEYGRTKLAAEKVVKDHCTKTGSGAVIFRLPNVFGKWCRPNYNSVVATFCYNTIHGIPIEVHDPRALVRLVYIDDVISSFLAVTEAKADSVRYEEALPVYETNVGFLSEQIASFAQSRDSLTTGRVGVGLIRALYATYISYLPATQFAYDLVSHQDQRGKFLEILKTEDSGQFSYFTAYPGVTRGGHYHHTKTEKFLVVKGEALFKFRNMDSGETHALEVSGELPQIVETVPGWAHDITNIGESEMLVMLWANEVFNNETPDTIGHELK